MSELGAEDFDFEGEMMAARAAQTAEEDSVVDENESEDVVEEEEEVVLERPVDNKKRTVQGRINDLTYKSKEFERRATSAENELLKYKLAEREREIAALVDAKVDAYENGDTEAMREIEKRLAIQSFNMASQPTAAAAAPDNYFATKYPWYEKNEKMKAMAQFYDNKLIKDSFWSSRPIEERLDQTAKLTLQAFKSTQRLTPTEGVSNTSGGNRSVDVSKAEMRMLARLYPDLKTETELRNLALELKGAKR